MHFAFPYFLILAFLASLALGLRAFWVAERLLPAAMQAGYQGFNRTWSLSVLPWRWPVRLLVTGEWLLLIGLLSLNTFAFASLTLLEGGALLALTQGQAASQRLKLSFHRTAWKNFRRSWRTAGALWLLKAGVLCMLAFRILAQELS